MTVKFQTVIRRVGFGLALVAILSFGASELYAGCGASIDCGGTPARVESCSCPGMGSCSSAGGTAICYCGTVEEQCTCAGGCQIIDPPI